MAIIFDTILQDAVRSGKFTGNQRQSVEWLRSKAMETTKAAANPQKILSDPNRGRTVIKPGDMFFFSYDPKGKKELPFYDKFPLIFPLRMVNDGFLGINMHYLHPKLRAFLMDALMKSELTNDKMDDTTKMKASYAILNASSQFKWFKPCVKKYLASHVKSRFVLVHPIEWNIALFIPSHQFVKERAEKVWKLSEEQIRKS